MTWQDIYLKYKDTELMKEFGEYVGDNDNFPAEVDENYLCDDNIKDIWGYLICFAETKGILINIISTKIDSTKHFWVNTIDIREAIIQNEADNVEQAMLWCADKFFEVSTN